MKTARIFMLTFLMSTVCVAMSYAQQGQRMQGTPEERAARQVERMKTSLNLTDDQAAKLQVVQTQFIKDREAARAAGAQVSREDMKAKTDAYEAQLKSILTPEQYQQYQDQRKAMRSRMQQGQQGQGQNQGQ